MRQCHEVQLVCSTNGNGTGMRYAKHFASVLFPVRCEHSAEAGHMLTATFLAVMSTAKVVSADG